MAAGIDRGLAPEDDTFAAVFTNGSLHEWSQAEWTLDEVDGVREVGRLRVR